MTIITKASLAAELGVTKPRISQYIKAGMPVRPDGRLDREAVLNWLERYSVSQTDADKGANRAHRLAREARNRGGGRLTPPPQPAYHGAKPPTPRCFHSLERLVSEPGHRLIGYALIGLALRIPANAATFAVRCGLPASQAYRLRMLMMLSIMQEVDEDLSSMGIIDGSSGPLTWHLPSFMQNDWKHLAELAGEPHDEKAWEAAMLKANREQMGSLEDDRA